MAVFDAQAFGRSAASSFQGMTGPQRLTLGLAFGATVLGIFFVASLTSATPMTTLYAGVDPADASAMVERLASRGVPYELADGGSTIKVPADQVDAARLDISGAGLTGGTEGWSILDDQGITTSSFDQRVGYQRAMEGELAKTIATIDGVSRANVHLAIPEHDLILDSTQQASASVLVVRSGTGALGPMQVDAIVNLVASSVEGLTVDRVSVADETGRVLAAAGEGSGVVGLEGDSQLRAKREYEALLEKDLESLLTAVVGPGLAVVNVSAELDFDSVTTVTETFQPTQAENGSQMLLAEVTRAEIYRDDEEAVAEEGELAVEPAEPAEEAAEAAAAEEGVVYSLDERDATFAVDKVVTNAENRGGGVTSLSVAVLLDEAAVDAAKVPEIEAAVSAAAGINLERGDTLAVTLIPINERFTEGVEALAFDPTEEAGGGLDLIGLIRTVLTGLLAIVVAVLGIRMVSKGPKTDTVGSIDLTDSGELPAGSDGDKPQLTEGSTGAASAAEGEGDGEDENELTQEQVDELISNQTDEVAGVLRSWLHETEAEGAR
ncbi:MAG: flagellar basal-body MS-ring/collar protein FliF [Actinomycetota bacterium]